MKKFSLLFYTGIVATVCASCGSDNSSQHSKNMVEHSYLLSFSFVDAEGRDLVKGIEGTEPEGSIEASYVVPDQYTLVSSPDRNELWPWEGSLPQELGMTPASPWESANPYPSIGLFSSSNGFDNLSITTTRAPWYEGVLETINYTLKCPHIFGDDAPHKIITYWELPLGDDSWYSSCYKVEIDGKEFNDITYARGKQLSFATIVLDR